MPNRVLRDGILRSERVDRLSPGAEIFYRRLMSVVDDYGRYYASPKLLNADCYPLKEESVPVEDYLAECSAGEQPLVIVYTVGGKRYLEIQEFQQRQRSESKFPAPPRPTAIRQHHDSGSPSRDRHSPSHVSASLPDDSNARPLRAGAVEGEGEGVCEVEGGDARTREATPPPPLNATLSSTERAEVAKLLQMAMRPGTTAPDAHLVGQVVAVLQGATMPELAAAILQRRRRGSPPNGYGFWPIYLQDVLAPGKRAALGAIATPVEDKPVEKQPACSRCGGSGVVGGVGEKVTAEVVRGAVARGARFCGCASGEGWAEFFRMDDEAPIDDVPTIQRQGQGRMASSAVAAAVAR